MLIDRQVKYPLFFLALVTFCFSRQILKNTQILNVMKISPVAAELFHTKGRKDGRTDTRKLLAAFRNFSNAPKMDLDETAWV